ncbi:MAG: HlyD family efflux transporter periplasmic adaptor subunit [Telluria sp.]
MKIDFASAPAAANLANGLSVAYAPAKRHLAKWRWRLLVLLVLSPLLVFLGRLLYGAVWADMPGFVIMEQTIVKAPLAGRLVRAPQAGTQVRAGELIAVLSNDLLENEHRLLLARRERVLEYVEPPVLRPPRIAALRAVVTHRRQQYEALRNLMAGGAATSAEVAASYAQLAQAEGELKTLEQEYAAALRQPRPPLPPPPPARLVEVEARLQSLQLKAPASGIVAQVFANKGEWINENAEVVDIRLDRPARVEVFVEPSWARYATVGRRATIHFLDGYTHRAQVREVKRSAQRLPADRANPLTVRHHSIIAMLEPSGPLPERDRIHVLPVHVQFDL